jgi:hypothetical protein
VCRLHRSLFEDLFGRATKVADHLLDAMALA